MDLNFPPAKQSVCTFVMNVHSMTNLMLDKTPKIVGAKVKFLGVVFDRILSYNNHVNYLNLRHTSWVRNYLDFHSFACSSLSIYAAGFKFQDFVNK